jgi:hypothetical protein
VLSGGARVTTVTAGAGDAGTIRVSSQGPLSLSDPGSGILVSTTSTARGNADRSCRDEPPLSTPCPTVHSPAVLATAVDGRLSAAR